MRMEIENPEKERARLEENIRRSREEANRAKGEAEYRRSLNRESTPPEQRVRSQIDDIDAGVRDREEHLM